MRDLPMPRRNIARPQRGASGSQPRKLVKEEIVRVAVQCFAQRGYQRTTLEDIVTRVGISRVTFYTYFESKAALFVAIVEQILEEYQRGIEKILPQPVSFAEKLHLAVVHHVSLLAQQGSFMRVLFSDEINLLPPQMAKAVEKKRQVVGHFLETTIAKGIEAGELIDENPQLLMYAFLGMCNWLYRWYRPGGPLTPEEIARVFSRVLQSGCLAQGARADNDLVVRTLKRVEGRLSEVNQELKQVTDQLSGDGQGSRT